MKPSQLLKKFLSTGKKPANQREVFAILDESRSLLVSKLPSTAVHIQNLTQGDIDGLVAGGKDGMIDRAVAIHRAQNLSAPRPSRPAAKARPTATAKPSAAPAPAPASRLTESTNILMRAATMRGISETDRMAARAELEARGFTELPKGGFTKSHQ